VSAVADWSETLAAGGTLDTPPDLPAPLAAAQQLLRALHHGGGSSTPVLSAGPRLVPGAKVGRYTLGWEVGRGGAGAVFAARDPALQRDVALKVLHPALAAHPAWAERFRAEGPNLAKLRHPHVVLVFEAGEADGFAYLAMELVNGPDLHARLNGRPVDPRTAAGWAADLADAVQSAHAAGLLHRDLKPGNVLLDPLAGPKLTDFGLAAPLDGGTGLTATGEIVGTPQYLAPEVLDGRVGPAADVYGLGTILYECLTGRPPFAGSNPALTLVQVRSADPVSPRAVNPDVPRDLDTVCLKCLAKRPDRRYRTASELAADLRAFLAGKPVSARPPGPAERLGRAVRRRPVVSAVVAAGAVAAVAGLGGWLHYTRQLAAALGQVQAEQANTAAALGQAGKRLTQLGRSNEALLGVFGDLDLRAVRAKGISVEQALADKLTEVAATLDGDAYGDPEQLALLQCRLGQTLQNLGRTDKATELYRAARQTFLARHGPDHEHSLSAANNLATALREAGDPAEGIKLYQDTFARRVRVLGPDHPQTLISMANLATGLKAVGRTAEAIPLNEELVERRKRVLGPDDPSTLIGMANLAVQYQSTGRYDKSVPLMEEVVRRGDVVQGADAPISVTHRGILAVGYSYSGRAAEAVPLLEDVTRRLLASNGPDHPTTILMHVNLGEALQKAGRPADALAPLAVAADAAARRKFQVLQSGRVVVQKAAAAHEAAGRHARAEPWRRGWAESLRGKPGEAVALAALGNNLLAQKKWAEAEAVWTAAHAVAWGPARAGTAAKRAEAVAGRTGVTPGR
jgi:tetratricopeptide (TPR) repeat protein